MIAGEVNRPSRQTEGNAVIKGDVSFLLMPTTNDLFSELYMTVASTG